MRQRFLGILIGSMFGMAFVLANAGDPVPGVTGGVLRVLAVIALLTTVALGVLAQRRLSGQVQPTPQVTGREPGRGADDRARRGGMFNGRYGLVVGAEVVLFAVGVAVIRTLDIPEQAIVAWIALVVGVHFLALAAVWRERTIMVPGAALSVLGVAGLVMVAVDAETWVPLVSGVLSGVTLLAGGLTSTARHLRGRASG